MELSSPQLGAFRAVLNSPGTDLPGFMKKTGLSRPRAYAVLKNLGDKGLVKSAGKPSKYMPSGKGEAAWLTRSFRLYGQYPLEKVLSGKNLKVLGEMLNESKSAEELAKAARLSKPQTYKILSRFSRMGLVKNHMGRYYVPEDHPLYKCLKEYGKPPKTDAQLEKNAAIIWQRDGEYLIQADDPGKYPIKKPWRYTSSSAVNRYGIDVIPPKAVLYAADKTNQVIKNSEGKYTSLEDTIIFTLIHDTKDSKNYARYMILLNKSKIDIPCLRKKAAQYGINETLESVLYDLKAVMRT